MNWRTALRVAVALVGFSVAGTVFYYSRREPPPPTLPAELPKLDPNVILQSGPGRQTIHDIKDGRPTMDVTYAGSRAYDDGRMRFEGAVIHGLRENSFTLRANVLETRGPITKGRPAQFELPGPFTFEGSDGMRVAGDQATYDDGTGVLTIPGPVTFSRGRLSGTSTGAVYDSAKDTVTFLEAAKTHVAADAEGKGAAEASAKRMLLVRGQHSLQLEEGARIAGDTQILTGQNATMVFAEDESTVKHLELRGNARVDPAPGAVANQPAMGADNLTMSFHPDGRTMQHATLTGHASLSTSDGGRARSIEASWIDLFTGPDGKTLTQLRARDKVAVTIPATATAAGREIHADQLESTGDAKKGLTLATFEGRPRFEEIPVAPPKGRGTATAGTKRTGSATVLVLTLGGQLDAIEKAEFRQNAEFEDDRVKASADVATYVDAKEDVLLLRRNTGAPRRLSEVRTSDNLTVTADEIDVSLDTENLEARNEVTTRTVRTGGQEQNAPGSLFGGKEAIIGSATHLRYRKETGVATYAGLGAALARLRQGETVISADRIEFTESTYRLGASGHVDSTLQMTAPGADSKDPAAPKNYRVRSETLAYDDARREAIYQGALATMTMSDGTTEARTLTFQLAKDSRELEHMRAEGDVFVTLSGGYQAVGDVLVYLAATDTHELTGKVGEPAMVLAPDKEGARSPSTCKLTTSLKVTLNRRTGAVAVPGSGQAPRSTVERPCTDSIRRRK